MRQVEEEEEEPIQTAPETVMRQVEEEEVQPFPESVMRAPEPPALPLAVQRQAEEEEEEEEEPIQTAPEAVMRAPAPDGTLLARVASRAQLPLIKRQTARTRPSGYGAPSRSMPVQRTAILPQARFEETPSWGGAPGQPGRSDPWAGTAGERLPVPAMTRMPVQRAAAAQMPTTSIVVRRSPDTRGEMPLPPIMTIQRQPTASALSSAPISVVQRVETGYAETTEQKEERPAQDLDKLARQVYPHIVRMLAIERERRTGRW
jgi:hypothetical protein